MAVRATQDNVAAEMRPPDYRSAVKRIRAMQAKKDKISEVNGQLADEWAKVEGVRVHKKAGKMFQTLDKMEAPERADIIRSLQGLMDSAGWADDITDMVDRAEDTSTSGRLHIPGEPEDDDGGDGGDDGNGGGEPAPEKKPDEPDVPAADKKKPARDRGTKPSNAEAVRTVADMAEARRRKLDEAAKAPIVPYTGDNSDLAQ